MGRPASNAGNIRSANSNMGGGRSFVFASNGGDSNSHMAGGGNGDRPSAHASDSGPAGAEDAAPARPASFADVSNLVKQAAGGSGKVAEARGGGKKAGGGTSLMSMLGGEKGAGLGRGLEKAVPKAAAGAKKPAAMPLKALNFAKFAPGAR